MQRYIFTETIVYAISASSGDHADELFEQWCADEKSVPVEVIDQTLDREGFYDGYSLS